MEDDSPVEPASTPGTLRNLSAWSVTIPDVDIYDDEVKREKIPVFCIHVERNDRKEGESCTRLRDVHGTPAGRQQLRDVFVL